MMEDNISRITYNKNSPYIEEPLFGATTSGKFTEILRTTDGIKSARSLNKIISSLKFHNKTCEITKHTDYNCLRGTGDYLVDKFNLDNLEQLIYSGSMHIGTTARLHYTEDSLILTLPKITYVITKVN